MSESKSKTLSLDIYSTRMRMCQAIYPHRIVRPLGKYGVNHKEQFSLFIDDLKDNNAKITQYIADNLKRATGKGCLNHSATFPCEYCFARGVRFQSVTTADKTKKHLELLRKKIQNVSPEDFETINNEIKKAEKALNSCRHSHIVWPSSTIGGEPRTVQKILDIIESIEERGKLPIDEAKGVVCRSPLLDIPDFDMVRDSPAEYLHSGCLGVTRKMLELTFSIGESRTRITTRKLSNPIDFNKLMQNIKVPHETSRRIRELDFAVMKGQEFRNIAIFFFPIIIDCINKPANERKLWLQFAYIMRACIIPTEEFRIIDDCIIITQTANEFYKLYEELFGAKNCTYNTHIIGAHIIEVRAHGPLTMTSAFGFESFYGEIRNWHPVNPQTNFQKNPNEKVFRLPLLQKFNLLQ